MPVGSLASSVTLTGDGTTTAISVPWAYDDADYLYLEHIAADGTLTVLSSGADYTITGNAESGFTVNLTNAPVAGAKVILDRRTPALQPEIFRDNAKFPAAKVSQGLDRTIRAMQDVQRDADRAIKFPREIPSGVTLPPVATWDDVILVLTQEAPFFRFQSSVNVDVVAGIKDEIALLGNVNFVNAATALAPADVIAAIGTLGQSDVIQDLAVLAQTNVLNNVSIIVDDIEQGANSNILNAKANADAALARANAAEEWANKPEDALVSALAGGDEVDDYSARHHAAKSALAQTGAQASATSASASAASALSSRDIAITAEARAREIVEINPDLADGTFANDAAVQAFYDANPALSKTKPRFYTVTGSNQLRAIVSYDPVVSSVPYNPSPAEQTAITELSDGVFNGAIDFRGATKINAQAAKTHYAITEFEVLAPPVGASVGDHVVLGTGTLTGDFSAMSAGNIAALVAVDSWVEIAAPVGTAAVLADGTPYHRTNSGWDNPIPAPVAADGMVPNTLDGTEIVIASGSVTPTLATHVLAAEADTSPTDSLFGLTVTGFKALASGTLIIKDGHTITFQISSGNLQTLDGNALVATGGDIIKWQRDDTTDDAIVWKVGSASAPVSSGSGRYTTVRLSDEGLTGTGNEYAALKTVLEVASNDTRVIVWDVDVDADFAPGGITLGGPQIWVNSRNNRAQGLNVTGMVGVGAHFFTCNHHFEIDKGFRLTCATMSVAELNSVGDFRVMFLLGNSHRISGKFIGKLDLDTSVTKADGTSTGNGITLAQTNPGTSYDFGIFEDFEFQDWWRCYFATNTDTGVRRVQGMQNGIASNIGKSVSVYNTPGAATRHTGTFYRNLVLTDCAMDASPEVTLGASYTSGTRYENIDFRGRHAVCISLEEAEGWFISGITGEIDHVFTNRSSQSLIHVKSNNVSGSPTSNTRMAMSDINVKCNLDAAVNRLNSTGLLVLSSVAAIDWDGGGIKDFEFTGFGTGIKIDDALDTPPGSFYVKDGQFTECNRGLICTYPSPQYDNLTFKECTVGVEPVNGGAIGKVTAIDMPGGNVLRGPTGAISNQALIFSDYTWMRTNQTIAANTTAFYALWNTDGPTSTGLSGIFTTSTWRHAGNDWRVARFDVSKSTQGGVTGNFADDATEHNANGSDLTWGDTDAVVSIRSGLGGVGDMILQSDAIQENGNPAMVASYRNNSGASKDGITVMVNFKGIASIRP